MIQRKLSMKRVHPELELEETETPDDLSVPVKPVRKISKGNTEQPRLEELQTDPVDNENTRDLAEDTNIEVSEADKNDILDDVQSSKDTTDQDSQSGTVSGLDDSSQEAGGSKRLRMYKCERCNTQYMGLAMLRQHCRDVHGDQKYYKCHVCGKLFSHPSSRNIHLRLHSGEKPYKCTTCGKQFRVSSHLKDHVRVHTGERPYICDICQKGFKQSSDLKKHRRTHTLDKPYKCPICPSAFTRSHHCRGHINSVHKFFKCVACSALFTSEEAFERHKEFHPSVFPDQADGERTPPEVSDSAQKGNARKESAQEEHDIHENNVKLDVANQLLELHKIMQQRSPLSTTTGSGSDTASDSGDDVSNRQSPAPDQVKPAEPEPSAAASPGLMYQEVSRRLSPSASHMEQVHSVPLKMTDDGVEIRVPQRYCHSPHPNPQGMGYLRVPFQSTIQVENRVTSPEQPGLVGGSLPERRRKSPVDPSMNVFHYTVNGIPQVQPMLQFAVSVDPRRHYTNAETFPRAEISRKSSVEAPKTTESQNTVPCHRVSVIQYHSSSPKPSDDEKSEEGSRKSSLQEADFKSRTSPLPETASKTLDNARPMDQTPNNMMPQSYGLTVNNMKYLVGIPPERIPYMPHTGEGMMILQPWMEELNKQIGNYSWMVKDEKKTSEELTTRGPAMLYTPSKFPLDVSQVNTEPSTSAYNAQTSQDVPTDMLKYLSLREQNKPKNEARDRRTPPGDDDSETSEASENGDEPNSRKLSAGARQESPSSESLTDPKDSSENSVHLCQVCNKTFSRSSLLKQHSVIHMGNKRFKFRCEVCGKMFRTRSHLRDHTRIHTGERPFKCHICQKAFKQSSDLKKHINLHTGANQFKCEECNMEFRRADALRKHKLGHKVGNMPCAHCGKNFLHIGALRAHRAMHNVQPVKASRSFHRCNYCFKTFTKAESYKIHIEEHTRDQSGAVVIFDCKICSMKFFTEAEFQDHMNIHNGKRPYKCFVCDKEFCIAEHLQDHVRLHSDATPRVRCEEGSDRSFQMPDQVIRHSAIHA